MSGVAVDPAAPRQGGGILPAQLVDGHAAIRKDLFVEGGVMPGESCRSWCLEAPS